MSSAQTRACTFALLVLCCPVRARLIRPSSTGMRILCPLRSKRPRERCGSTLKAEWVGVPTDQNGGASRSQRLLGSRTGNQHRGRPRTPEDGHEYLPSLPPGKNSLWRLETSEAEKGTRRAECRRTSPNVECSANENPPLPVRQKSTDTPPPFRRFRINEFGRSLSSDFEEIYRCFENRASATLENQRGRTRSGSISSDQKLG